PRRTHLLHTPPLHDALPIFHKVGPAVLRRELLQIDGRGNPDREGDKEADKQRVEGSDQRTGKTGKLRKPAVGIEEQGPVEEGGRSEEHTSELQSRENLVCRL